jgi:signal transduction histidine kinase
LIERQGKRLRDLIDDLLITARLESGNIQPSITRVSVPDVCTAIVQAFAAQETGHTFALDLADLPMIATDEASLHRILGNLVSNAVKYSSRGSTIRITAAPAGSEITLSVTNEGSGIPASHHEAIFDRFVRLHRNGDGGTGLGLYVCRKLAESLGGRVWLERSDERGSTFTLALPPRITTAETLRIPSLH